MYSFIYPINSNNATYSNKYSNAYVAYVASTKWIGHISNEFRGGGGVDGVLSIFRN